MANSKILTAEQEKTLRQPIEEYVGKIQKEIDELRKDGTAKVIIKGGTFINFKSYYVPEQDRKRKKR